MTRHEKVWILLMLSAIALSFILPKPLGVVQAAICGASLGVKIERIFERKRGA